MEFDADLDNEKHRNRNSTDMKYIHLSLSFISRIETSSLSNFLAELFSERNRSKFHLRSEKISDVFAF